MADNFTDWLKSLPIPWLTGNSAGQANAEVLGNLVDTQTDYTKQAVKAHMPDYAPADALPHIASERGLIQGPSESNASFATRLKFSWEQWQFAGSPLGILIQLYYQGYTNMVLVQQNGLAFTLTGTLPAFTTPGSWDPTPNLVITNTGTNPNISGTPSWWTFDLNNPFCSRYALIFPQSLPASWTNVISPPTPTTAPTLSQINTIRSILKTWSAGKATCVGIYAVTQNKCIGYPVRLINSGTYAGSTIGPSSVVVFTP